jgi:hypothetical protein
MSCRGEGSGEGVDDTLAFDTQCINLAWTIVVYFQPNNAISRGKEINFFSYKSRKREVKTKLMNESVR